MLVLGYGSSCFWATERPVALGKIFLTELLLRIPLLALSLLVDSAAINHLVLSCIAKLEMWSFDLSCLILTDLFSDILSNFFGLLSGLGSMIWKLVAVTVIAVYTVAQVVVSWLFNIGDAALIGVSRNEALSRFHQSGPSVGSRGSHRWGLAYVRACTIRYEFSIHL